MSVSVSVSLSIPVTDNDHHHENIIRRVFINKDEINNLKKGIVLPMDEIMDRLCFQIDKNSNVLYFDTRYFKYVSVKMSNEYVILYVSSIFKEILKTHRQMVIHVNMKSIDLTFIDKQYDFIKQIAEYFKTNFPERLDTCYVYNASFIFSALFRIIKMMTDKDTQKRIKLVE